MNLLIIFEPLRDRKTLRKGMVATVIIAGIYTLLNIFLLALSVGTENLSIPDVLQFVVLNLYLSSILTGDWIFLLLIPLLGGLLHTNYTYWKCKPGGGLYSGAFAGILGTTCIACVLPVLGLAAFATSISTVSIYLKYAAVLILVGSTYYVANKQKACKAG